MRRALLTNSKLSDVPERKYEYKRSDSGTYPAGKVLVLSARIESIVLPSPARRAHIVDETLSGNTTRAHC
jgi:hypothetical protein